MPDEKVTSLYMNTDNGVPSNCFIVFYKVVHHRNCGVTAKRYFALRGEIPKTNVPFIGINIDDLADKTRKFTGYLLHPLNRQIFLILQVHTSCGIPGRLSLDKRIDFFKTEALNKITSRTGTALHYGQYTVFSPISIAKLI